MLQYGTYAPIKRAAMLQYGTYALIKGAAMLQYFFENSKKDNKDSNSSSAHLFEGLNIMKAGKQYTSHMGQYTVINLSLKSAKQPTVELAYISIRRRIAEEYKRHEYILEH